MGNNWSVLCKRAREPTSVKNAEINSLKVFAATGQRESPHLQSCNECYRAKRA